MQMEPQSVAIQKAVPADPDVSRSLADFGIDIEDYKRSLNPDPDKKLLIDGKTVNQSYSFSNLLLDRIKNDEWFKQNLEIDERFIHVTNKLVQTTSSIRKF